MALTFNGKNMAVRVTDEVLTLDGLSEATVSAWLLNPSDDFGFIVHSGYGAYWGGWQIQQRGDLSGVEFHGSVKDSESYKTRTYSDDISPVSGWVLLTWVIDLPISSLMYANTDEISILGEHNVDVIEGPYDPGAYMAIGNGTQYIPTHSENGTVGTIGPVGLWNRKLTPSEIATMLVSKTPLSVSSGLIAAWLMDEGNPGEYAAGEDSILDSSGNGYHLTPHHHLALAPKTNPIYAANPGDVFGDVRVRADSLPVAGTALTHTGV